MGFYDGVSGTTDTASAAHLARETRTPAVLVVSPKGQSLTLAAMLFGLRQFAENTLQGVIFNGISKGMYPFYRAIAEKGGLRAYGYLPRVPAASIPDRHLGLVTAGEIADLQRKLDQLADSAEEGLDLDGLLALAQSAPTLADRMLPLEKAASQPVRIAVARDAAFCFYYEDNLDVLCELGAEIVEFSPLADGHLPDGIDGLYLGGGYPELYAAKLAENQMLRAELRARIADGLPTVAECGGFMYLHEHIGTSEGNYPMVGVIPGTARMTGKLQNFGYVTLTVQQDGLLGPKRTRTRAHEFHYAASDDAGSGMEAKKPNGRAWPCVHVRDTLYAGYPHLYFRSNPELAANFVRKCASMR